MASHLLEQKSDTKIPEQWFDAFATVLSTKQQWRNAKGTRAGAALLRHAQDAENFMNSIMPEKVKRDVGRAAVRRHLVVLLVEDLQKRKLTPSPTMLADNLPRMAEVLDNAYPGFRLSGLTHLIFDRFAGGKHEPAA